MNKNKKETGISIDDMDAFKVLFAKQGYAIVNDFELPESEELGFDITGNETIQPNENKTTYNYDDMSEIEKYLNGCGYSIVSGGESEGDDALVISTNDDSNFCNKYIGEMALVRTCSSFLALMVSFVITYKVW